MADASSVDFRALQLFIAVYDNQSFSVVARREGVSPSLISRTIQQLEDALGQQLFYRNTRAVVPTEAGRLFAASARELLGQYADAQRALQDRAQVPGGLVDVGEAVDPPAGVGGDGGHQVLVLRHLGQVVGHAHAVQRGPQNGVVHRVLHLFPKQIYLHLPLPDALNVLLARHQ